MWIDNSLFIDMSLRILHCIGFVLKLALVVIVVFVSISISCLLSVSLVVIVMLFSGIEFFENLQPFFLLHIVVMHELWMVERDVGQRFAKIV